jgi:hypothetical protein
MVAKNVFMAVDKQQERAEEQLRVVFLKFDDMHGVLDMLKI